MIPEKIENLEELISLSKNRKISRYEIKRLTEPGENYCSLVLAVKLFIESSNDNREDQLNVLVKIPPPTEFLRNSYKTSLLFDNEIKFYKQILPILDNFLTEINSENILDYFPKLFGTRQNLNNTKECDENAVIVMENLRNSEFKLCDCILGFNIAETKLILKSLAYFHSVPLAMKLLKTDEFNVKLLPFLHEYNVYGFDKVDWEPMIHEQFRESLVADPDALVLLDRALKQFNSTTNVVKGPRNCSKYIREPFSTIIHTDMWVNNILIKYEDGQPIKIKFVDFQVYEYGSPARDLLFFLYTSVQLPILKQNRNYLIQFYYDELINNLQGFKCDTDQFSWIGFQGELKFAADYHVFTQISMQLNTVCASKSTVKELSDMDQENLAKKTEISKIHKERLIFTVKSFNEHFWICQNH